MRYDDPHITQHLGTMPTGALPYAFAALAHVGLEPDTHEAGRLALYLRAEADGLRIEVRPLHVDAVRLLLTGGDPHLSHLNGARRAILKAAGALDDMRAGLQFALHLLSHDVDVRLSHLSAPV